MSLDAITVMATKTEEKTTDALAAVSSVRSDQIGQIMADKTSNVFFGVPGVWFQERADDPGSSVNIRGLQDFGRVAVLIDGARQNFQRSGHNADGLYYFEPELLAGADVVRGPIANIYGSGAIGGVVSLRTKDADDVIKPGDTWGVLSHGQLGSNRFKALGSTFLGVRANPNVDVFVGGTYRDHLNYRDGNSREVLNSLYQTDTGIAKVTVRPALGHEVKFSGLTYETAFRNGTPNATNTATVYDSTVKNNIASARWKYHRPEDRLMDFDANVYWTKTETNQTKILAANSAISGLLGSVRNFQIDTVGTDINNTSRFDTGPFRHAVTYGGDWFRDRVNVIDPTGTGDLFTPNGERTVGGGFAQIKSSYSSWLDVIGAIRYDNFNLTGGSTNSSGDRFSPKMTVGITPVKWFTVYGTYAEGYRAPAITEVFVSGQHPNAGPGSAFIFLPNGTLRPEVGKTKEVGINIRQDNWWMQGDAFRMKANVFRNDVDDFIEQKTVLNGQQGVNGLTCTATANCIQYQNLTHARIDGAEFEANYDMGRYFYGLSATHLRGSNVDTRAPLLKIAPPSTALTLGARYLDRKLTTALRIQWADAKPTGQIPTGNTTPSTSAYTIVNLYAGYQVNEDVLAEFAIDNLLNTYYERYLDVTTSGSSVIASPSPGITFKGGVKIRFGDSYFKNASAKSASNGRS